MAYATLQQLVDKFGLRELAQLLCDEERLVTDDLLRDKLAGDVSAWSQEEQDAITTAELRAAAALDRVSDLIDSAIGSRYNLPLTNPAYGPIVDCCLALSRAELSEDGDNISTTVKEERTYWRKWLERIENGKKILPGETQQGVSGHEQGRHCGTMPSSVDWEAYP